MGMGKHQERLMKFVIDYPGWHSMASTARGENDALDKLCGKGFIEIVDHGKTNGRRNRQFRLRLSKYERKEGE